MMHLMRVPNWGAFNRTWNKRRKGFYDEAMKLVVQDIVDGIERGIDATGHSFPALEPETIARKGHDRPLINRGLLSSEGTYRRKNLYSQDRGEVSIKSVYAALVSSQTGAVASSDMPRNKVGVELQIDGIDSKSGTKYFRFFGISRDAQDQILQLVSDIVQESLEAM